MSAALQKMTSDIALLRGALAIARRAVIEDIEDECNFHWAAGHAWYDLTPMTDPREHCQAVIDMAREALAWGRSVGLLIDHPMQPNLVRIVHPPI